MSRNMSADLANPHLFEEHSPGAYEYGTLGNGDKYATGTLTLGGSHERDAQAQRAAGGEQRRDGEHEWGPDDGGHLIGARFSGSPGEENLTAQSRNLNRQDYRRMEDEWARHIDNGDKVFVHIETSGGQRPDAYMGYVIYEHPDGTRDYNEFHMANESRATHAQWEEGFEEWEQENPGTPQRDPTLTPEQLAIADEINQSEWEESHGGAPKTSNTAKQSKTEPETFVDEEEPEETKTENLLDDEEEEVETETFLDEADEEEEVEETENFLEEGEDEIVESELLLDEDEALETESFLDEEDSAEYDTGPDLDSDRSDDMDYD